MANAQGPAAARRSLARPDVEELVASARGGDRAAFEELVRRTYADTYALAYRMTGNEDDASDVLQDAYLRAYRGLRRFRGDAAFPTWLYRITANCASTHLTRRGRSRHDELRADTAVADERIEHDPQARLNAVADRDRVAAAVAELPLRLRAVVVLRDVYDLPHQDIAAELGITVTAAKVRLHRARKRLRERLFPVRGDVVAPGQDEARPVGGATPDGAGEPLVAKEPFPGEEALTGVADLAVGEAPGR